MMLEEGLSLTFGRCRLLV